MVSPAALPRIRSCQIGLQKPAQIDQIKADMRASRFYYSEPRAIIAGWRDSRGTYYINDGNHRMAAALELFRETGNAEFVLSLLRWGRWTETRSAPIGHRPMPTRGWWGRLRNWIGL